MSVKGNILATEEVRQFLELSSGAQAARGALVGVHGSQISRWTKELRRGDAAEIYVQPDTFRQLEQQNARLRGRDPTTAAYKAGLAKAEEIVGDALTRLRELREQYEAEAARLDAEAVELVEKLEAREAQARKAAASGGGDPPSTDE